MGREAGWMHLTTALIMGGAAGEDVEEFFLILGNSRFVSAGIYQIKQKILFPRVNVVYTSSRL